MPNQQPCYVYRMFDANGALLYIGMSNDFAYRLWQHMSEKPWAHEIAKQTVTRYASRQEAEDAEAAAIAAEAPRYNKTYNKRPVVEHIVIDCKHDSNDWAHLGDMARVLMAMPFSPHEPIGLHALVSAFSGSRDRAHDAISALMRLGILHERRRPPHSPEYLRKDPFYAFDEDIA